MTRTTPPRPLDVETFFPELRDHRGTTTRLHPRPGRPTVAESSVGGPMLWPAEEPWPVCGEDHDRSEGLRPADVHRYRQVLAASWAREEDPGPTEEERELLDELSREHRLPETSRTDPLPMIGLAQLYRRDVADLRPGPGDHDLLQVFVCPFDEHDPSGYDLGLHLRWRRSWEVGEVLAVPPQPSVVGFDGYVPEPCVLHPEQVTTYPYADLLPGDLGVRLDAWDEALEEEARRSGNEAPVRPVNYQDDLSVPPGWRAGGFASWHVTDPYPVDCRACGAPMHLLLTVDSSEWDRGSASWTPQEEQGLPAHRYATPTEVIVGRSGELNVFACPADPGHPHRWSVQ